MDQQQFGSERVSRVSGVRRVRRVRRASRGRRRVGTQHNQGVGEVLRGCYKSEGNRNDAVVDSREMEV
jgi:hypothetical protein